MNTARSRFIAAAFDHGQVPTIACFNKATTALGVDFDRLLAALQKFVDQYFVPVWGTPARLLKTAGFRKGAWALAFLDRADVANALGYHDLTPDGLPLSKVFVQTTLAAKQKVSVTACHELAAMLVDPAINQAAAGPRNGFYAYETAAVVVVNEVTIVGIAMSDFVYPAWFEGFRKPGSAQFDYAKKVRRPFQILAGGYMSVFKNGKWTEIFGSRAKARRFPRDDPRGHRRSYPPRSQPQRRSA